MTRAHGDTLARPPPAGGRGRWSRRRPLPSAWPTRGPSRERCRQAQGSRSSCEAYARRFREIELAHPLASQGDESLARRCRVGDERRDVDALTGGREGPQAVDAYLEEDRCAVEIAAAPVLECDADLENPVLEIAARRARRSPEAPERLVLRGAFG